MEVKSARTAVQLHVAATAVDNSGSEEGSKQQLKAVSLIEEADASEAEEESVKIFISADGLRRSKSYEEMTAKDGENVSEAEVEEMMKKMEGLSSQIINGHFSMTDRLNFQTEIRKLTTELNRLNGDGISFSKADNIQLSQRISDLTRSISEAAVYHRSAKALFMVKNQNVTSNSRTRLDIAI